RSSDFQPRAGSKIPKQRCRVTGAKRKGSNVIDPVRTARAILPAGSLAVAKTPSWCAGLQAGRIRLEARIPADQYKRPRGRPLTQVRAQNWIPSDLVAFGVADSSVSLLLCARDVFLETFCYFVWYRSEPHNLNHE